MKKTALVMLLVMYGGIDLSAQIIADNFYAFGFENVFNWNIVFIDKVIDNEHVRLVSFEDMATTKDRIITCSLAKLDSLDFTGYINSLKKIEIVERLDNPYSRGQTLIIKSPDNEFQLYALIDHFGYVLHVSYLDRTELNEEKFIQMVKTYTNLKLSL